MTKILALFGFAAIALFGCDGSSPATPEIEPLSTEQATPDSAAPIAAVVDFSPVAEAFQTQAQIDSKDMLNHCSALQADIVSFLEQPLDTRHIAAQDSFLACYQSWANISLFFQQPFDLADKKDFQNLVELIDTRPFLPGYIDGIPEYPFSGLVHELDIPINLDTLRSQHRLMDEESASVGFPVIEFFLWKMPVSEHWLPVAEKENETIVERRKQYLLTASTLLLDHLSTAVVRWQEGSRFDQLPERAQLALVLKSLQRITMVDLLAKQFEETVLTDADWHHPAPISGHGRSYSAIRLKSLQNFVGQVGDTPFSLWLTDQPNLSFTIDELRATIKTTLTHLQSLPENYPFDAKPDDNWQSARQNLAQLALDLSALSKSLQVTVVTE